MESQAAVFETYPFISHKKRCLPNLLQTNVHNMSPLLVNSSLTRDLDSISTRLSLTSLSLTRQLEIKFVYNCKKLNIKYIM